MKLIPASSARWMIRMLSSWSGLPQAPNIIAPRQNLLTETPVRPRGRCSTRSVRLKPARLPPLVAVVDRELFARPHLPERPERHRARLVLNVLDVRVRRVVVERAVAEHD